ncbi:MAG: hypothetical protein N0C90_27110 [Candidatus Thiodiazotropha endolucinida]|nr:hypothetical protein [Candidatus Thiodiazotropha taylori]MCW4265017.1 hypothetical protein [Candidatus Thiodiazotropha endolucinida]
MRNDSNTPKTPLTKDGHSPKQIQNDQVTLHSSPQLYANTQSKVPDQPACLNGPGEQSSSDTEFQNNNEFPTHSFITEIPEISVLRQSGNSGANNQTGKLDIGKLQFDCSEIKPLYVYLRLGTLPNNLTAAKRVVAESQQYQLLNGKLYHLFQNRAKNRDPASTFIYQLVVPKCLRQDLLYSYHDKPAGGCHLGFQRVYESLRSKYYWKGLYQDTYDYVTSCETCQLMKRDTNKRNTPLKSLEIEPIFSKWHIDYLSGLNESRKWQ